jgi:hypothetical protein
VKISVVVLAVVMLIVFPGGALAQAEKGDPSDTISNLSSLAPRYSRDNLEAWAAAWAPSQQELQWQLAPSRAFPQQQGRRNRALIVVGAILLGVGTAVALGKEETFEEVCLNNACRREEKTERTKFLAVGIPTAGVGAALIIAGARRR